MSFLKSKLSGASDNLNIKFPNDQDKTKLKELNKKSRKIKSLSYRNL